MKQFLSLAIFLFSTHASALILESSFEATGSFQSDKDSTPAFKLIARAEIKPVFSAPWQSSGQISFGDRVYRCDGGLGWQVLDGGSTEYRCVLSAARLIFILEDHAHPKESYERALALIKAHALEQSSSWASIVVGFSSQGEKQISQLRQRFYQPQDASRYVELKFQASQTDSID